MYQQFVVVIVVLDAYEAQLVVVRFFQFVHPMIIRFLLTPREELYLPMVANLWIRGIHQDS